MATLFSMAWRVAASTLRKDHTPMAEPASVSKKYGHESGQRAATKDVGGAGCRAVAIMASRWNPPAFARAPHWRGCTGTCAQAVALGNITPTPLGLQSVTICLHCGWTIATCRNLSNC